MNPRLRQKEAMKVLQIAPIFQKIDETEGFKYGGIERVLTSLHREFNKKGHISSVAASANSNINPLIPTIETHLWGLPAERRSDYSQLQEEHFRKVLETIKKSQYDVIHDHSGKFVISRGFERYKEKLLDLPKAVTLHFYENFGRKFTGMQDSNLWFIVLSEAQKKLFSNIVPEEKTRVIYNGLNTDNFPFQEKKEDYIFSIGSIEPDKGQDLAVKLANKTNTPLIIAGPVADNDFFELEIEPYINGQIKYVGELNDKEKKEYYKNALASILPIKIHDCHTLIRLESQACGTPIITIDIGSAAESTIHGNTGYLCSIQNNKQTLIEMQEYLKRIKNKEISPYACREFIKETFPLEKQVSEHLKFYEEIIKK